MKLNSLYLIIPAIVFGSGCFDGKNSNPIPVASPSGTFSGEFKRTHTNPKTGSTDSVKAIIQLQMEATGYKVSGDTSTLHAGSYGSFVIGADHNGIVFVDKTYPITGTPSKVHLSGAYQYTYQGSNLQMVAYGSLDTLSFYYNLTRTGN